MFAAATCTDNSIRDAFVSWVHQVASTGTNSTPLGVVFNLTSNVISRGTNSPAHGSLYALLAVSESSPNFETSNLGGKSSTARIIGGTIGGLTLVLCVSFALSRVLRRRRASSHARAHWLFPIPYLQSTPSSGPRAAFISRLFARADDKVEKRREVAANGLRDTRNTSDGPGWAPGENRGSHEAVSEVAQASIKSDTQTMNETAMEMKLQVRQEKLNALYERRGRPSRSYVPELLSGSDLERPPSYDGH
ncbi:hypothetical protein SCHPADRAFT_603275 [Schizopora paradoxa]|uniref:Uncharacterized protein n=1 Tax=Schizopora paradoxa TaxID=27342 RepID=A0A0H2RGC1_9AGAM|nr:hypothetical protein SCHPADRAFT_603275 [Schizopora paradoxa]